MHTHTHTTVQTVALYFFHLVMCEPHEDINFVPQHAGSTLAALWVPMKSLTHMHVFTLCAGVGRFPRRRAPVAAAVQVSQAEALVQRDALGP